MQIEITYKNKSEQDQCARKTVLTVKDLARFRAAVEEAMLASGLEGEDLIAALMAQTQKQITKVERYWKYNNEQDYFRNDGAQGQKAIEVFDPASGLLSEDWHYTGGDRNDCKTGAPCHRSFNNDGSLLYTQRYQNDLREDGKNGEAGLVLFGDDGNISRESHYKKDKLNDGQDGAPALQWFKAGVLERAQRYENDVFGAELMTTEIKTLNAATKEAAQAKVLRESLGLSASSGTTFKILNPKP